MLQNFSSERAFEAWISPGEWCAPGRCRLIDWLSRWNEWRGLREADRRRDDAERSSRRRTAPHRGHALVGGLERPGGVAGAPGRARRAPRLPLLLASREPLHRPQRQSRTAPRPGRRGGAHDPTAPGDDVLSPPGPPPPPRRRRGRGPGSALRRPRDPGGGARLPAGAVSGLRRRGGREAGSLRGGAGGDPGCLAGRAGGRRERRGRGGPSGGAGAAPGAEAPSPGLGGRIRAQGGHPGRPPGASLSRLAPRDPGGARGELRAPPRGARPGPERRAPRRSGHADDLREPRCDPTLARVRAALARQAAALSSAPVASLRRQAGAEVERWALVGEPEAGGRGRAPATGRSWA